MRSSLLLNGLRNLLLLSVLMVLRAPSEVQWKTKKWEVFTFENTTIKMYDHLMSHIGFDDMLAISVCAYVCVCVCVCVYITICHTHHEVSTSYHHRALQIINILIVQYTVVLPTIYALSHSFIFYFILDLLDYCIIHLSSLFCLSVRRLLDYSTIMGIFTSY